MDRHNWIAADWGTTNLRLWAMRNDEALDHRAFPFGMDGLSRDDFAPALSKATEGWGPAPVVACGMVGARQGWAEAPYATTPVSAAPRLIQVPGHQVWIIGGIQQIDPPDVMRGEETQIAGLLAAWPEFDGVVCLPGTHTKWARLSAGEICHFQSCMTGEIFALLSQHSVLRHSLGQAAPADIFDTAVTEALSQPNRIYGRLFTLRAGSLIHNLPENDAASRLSGWLVGLELAASKAYWLGQEVVLIGAPALVAFYDRALKSQGAATRIANAESTTLAGLVRGWKALEKTL